MRSIRVLFVLLATLGAAGCRTRPLPPAGHASDGATTSDTRPDDDAQHKGPTLTPVWSRSFGGDLADVSQSLAIDPDGNIYLTGSFRGAVDFGGGSLTSAGHTDIFLVSYTAGSAHRFSRRFGGTSWDRGMWVAVDELGNVYITGSFGGAVDFGGGQQASAGGDDVFLASYTADGSHRFSRRAGGTERDRGYSLAVDQSGDLHLTGLFQGVASFGGKTLASAGQDDVFWVSYRADGSPRSVRRFGGIGNDQGLSIATDRENNVYLTGSFEDSVDFGGDTQTSAGHTDIFLTSFRVDGSHRFSRRFGASSFDSGRAVAVNRAGNVYLAGQFEGTIDLGGELLTSAGGADAFIASYTAHGVHRFSRRLGGSAWDYGISVTLDPIGDVYLAGLFRGALGPLSAAGEHDIFVASYAASGALRFMRRFGGTSGERLGSVAVDHHGAVYLTGSFAKTVDFGAGQLVSSGDTDVFLAKFAPR